MRELPKDGGKGTKLSFVRQEDEVLRRYNANGRKGLRGLVAQVLRQRDWQFRDGHPNEEKGRNRCYSRVYEILHPARRRTKRQ